MIKDLKSETYFNLMGGDDTTECLEEMETSKSNLKIISNIYLG